MTDLKSKLENESFFSKHAEKYNFIIKLPKVNQNISILILIHLYLNIRTMNEVKSFKTKIFGIQTK